jgi:hypothetical protein
MTDDFIRYNILGGKYAGLPDTIVSLFAKYHKLQNNPKQQQRALEYISQDIDYFRQWAYRQADGDANLLAEIDTYIKDLYDFVKNWRKHKRFDNIERLRLKAQKVSLTEKLQDYIPVRLISGGQESIDGLLRDIENSEHITDYPTNPSFKWHNSEIERLSLLSEKIKLLMKLVEKIHPENANKYHYLHYLSEITGDIAGYVGTLELSRNKLDWSIIDRSINDVRSDVERHFSELKERLTSSKPLAKPNGKKANLQPPEGIWSKPMSKVDIMKKLGFGLRGYRKLDTFAKDHPIIPSGDSGQLWMIRLDKMPLNLQEKFK